VITAAVREEENQDLLRLSGANQVVVSSGAAGQLLAITATRPAAGRVIAGLLGRGRGLELVERPVAAAEVGTPARDADGTVIALVRGDDLLPADHPDARRLAGGDRLIVVSSRQRPIIGHDITEPREFAHASHLV
jgi:voltage-gated potassium channel